MSKIILPIAELKPALVGLGKIIQKSSTLPVLRMVRVDRTQEGWITLTGTNLDGFITARLEEPSEGEPASILVSHEDLSRIAKRCGKDESLVIENGGVDKALVSFTIGNQTAEEHIDSLPMGDFPPIPQIAGDAMALPDSLRKALHEAMVCASEDATRPILNGAYIDVTDPKCHQVVGTDGKHLYCSNSFTLPLKNSLLIPNHKFLAWKEFNADGNWQLVVKEDKKSPPWIQISSRRWQFIVRGSEGQYPNWKQVLPNQDGFKTTIQFAPAQVDAVIGCVSRIPDGDKVNHAITIHVEGSQVFLGNRPVKVKVETFSVKGPNALIALNREFLSQALSFGLCRVQIADALSPLRFSDNAGHQMIVMPCRPSMQIAAPVKAEPEQQPTQQQEPEAPTTVASPIERKPMVNQNNQPEEQPSEVDPIDQALEVIEALKDTLQDATSSLKELSNKLKLIQRERKTNTKEIQSFRNTIRSLQALKI